MMQSDNRITPSVCSVRSLLVAYHWMMYGSSPRVTLWYSMNSLLIEEEQMCNLLVNEFPF